MTQRLNEVFNQNEVYLIKRPSGRSGNKVHLNRDCQYLNRHDTTVVSKPASSYPVGFHDICEKCNPDHQEDTA